MNADKSTVSAWKNKGSSVARLAAVAQLLIGFIMGSASSRADTLLLSDNFNTENNSASAFNTNLSADQGGTLNPVTYTLAGYGADWQIQHGNGGQMLLAGQSAGGLLYVSLNHNFATEANSANAPLKIQFNINNTTASDAWASIAVGGAQNASVNSGSYKFSSLFRGTSTSPQVTQQFTAGTDLGANFTYANNDLITLVLSDAAGTGSAFNGSATVKVYVNGSLQYTATGLNFTAADGYLNFQTYYAEAHYDNLAVSLINNNLDWNNAAGTGNWNTTDANWTGAIWANGLDKNAFFSHTASPAAVTLAQALTAGSVMIGNGGNNANYTFIGGSGGSLQAASLILQAASANDPNSVGYPTTTLSNANISVSGNIGIGRARLIIGGNSVVTADQIGGNIAGVSSADWGILTIQNNAVVTATNGVNGDTTAWGLNLNGGTLITSGIRVSPLYGNTDLKFNGALVRASADNDSFVTIQTPGWGWFNPPSIGINGVTFDTQGHSIGLTIDLAGAGGLTKTGNGTLTLSGANTYTGNTTISAGTLALIGSGSIAITSLSIAPNATFDVSAISGSGYTLPSGTLTMGIDKTSGIRTQGQMVIGDKSLTCAGTLTVNKTGSDALSSGDSFTLVTKSSGTLSGWFNSVALPSLTGGLAWDTNNVATAGILDVYNFTTTALEVSTPENSNAVVSASKLANHASSSKGTAVAVSASTPGHGTASITGGSLTYSPQGGYVGPDSFTVTFSDGHGVQTMAVSVTVGSATGTSPNLLGQMVDGSNFVLKFAGYPGQSYTVETNPIVGPGWVKLGNVMAPTDGIISVTNAMGTNSLFFRTVWPAY